MNTVTKQKKPSRKLGVIGQKDKTNKEPNRKKTF